MNLNEAKQILKNTGYIIERSMSLKDKMVNAKLDKIKEVLTSFKYKITDIEQIAEPHLKPKYRIYYRTRKTSYFIDCYLEDKNSFTVRYAYGGFCFGTDGETFEEAIENLIRNYKDE